MPLRRLTRMTILTTHNGKYPSSILPSYELPLWSITGKPKHRTDTRQQLVPRAFLPPHISEARRHAAITNPLHSVKKPATRQKPEDLNLITAQNQLPYFHRDQSTKDNCRAAKPVLGTGRVQQVFGGAGRDRTDDLLLAKQALSQLSYGPAPKLMVGPGRFELPTSRLSGVRSNQLSYRPERGAGIQMRA